MTKIIFVCHCVLNTASKVVMYEKEDMRKEEDLRLCFMRKALEQGVQFVQLPCPEFKMYGARRWGHVSNQFDNPFFRSNCRDMLKPIIMELQEYLSCKERFKVLGIVGIDGSPSCGVNLTCCADWYGSFGEREGLQETLSEVKMVSKQGIFIQELCKLLQENNLQEIVPLKGLFADNPSEIMSLLEE